MENMTVMEIVDFTIRVANFMEWYSLFGAASVGRYF
jgi:hypothetical protein